MTEFIEPCLKGINEKGTLWCRKVFTTCPSRSGKFSFSVSNRVFELPNHEEGVKDLSSFGERTSTDPDDGVHRPIPDHTQVLINEKSDLTTKRSGFREEEPSFIGNMLSIVRVITGRAECILGSLLGSAELSSKWLTQTTVL